MKINSISNQNFGKLYGTKENKKMANALFHDFFDADSQTCQEYFEDMVKSNQKHIIVSKNREHIYAKNENGIKEIQGKRYYGSYYGKLIEALRYLYPYLDRKMSRNSIEIQEDMIRQGIVNPMMFANLSRPLI